jgi:hypothetical protein
VWRKIRSGKTFDAGAQNAGYGSNRQLPQDEHDPAVLRVQGFEPSYSAEGAWLANAALTFQGHPRSWTSTRQTRTVRRRRVPVFRASPHGSRTELRIDAEVPKKQTTVAV